MLREADLLVVGGGVAGLSAALTAAAAGVQVVLLSKGSLASSNSYLAQGGVAAALAADDSPQLHAHDTLAAGRGLCRESAVRLLTVEAPPTQASKRELWQAAGLTRDGRQLERMLGSPSLLLRLVAASALLRRESRGVHFRSDHPSEDDRFAGLHITLGHDSEARLERWS